MELWTLGPNFGVKGQDFASNPCGNRNDVNSQICWPSQKFNILTSYNGNSKNPAFGGLIPENCDRCNGKSRLLLNAKLD